MCDYFHTKCLCYYVISCTYILVTWPVPPFSLLCSVIYVCVFSLFHSSSPVPPISVSTTQATPVNPCDPSPCGPNSQCRVVGDTAACTCLPNYIGRPPSCRPECLIHAECASNLACVAERCVDPCPGSCGAGASCRVINHNAVCTCPPGYTGDATVFCTLLPSSKYKVGPLCACQRK